MRRMLFAALGITIASLVLATGFEADQPVDLAVSQPETETAAIPVRPVEVVNFPDPQAVTGSVAIDNLPDVQEVGGAVAISNLPSVQQVSGEVTVTNLGDGCGQPNHAVLAVVPVVAEANGTGGIAYRSEPFSTAGYTTVVAQLVFATPSGSSAAGGELLFRNFEGDPFSFNTTPDSDGRHRVLGAEARAGTPNFVPSSWTPIHWSVYLER